jgi:CrcB protein
VALVFAGGVAGTTCRYLVGVVVGGWGVWPAATFSVNLTGAFALGLLLSALGQRGPDVALPQRLRLLLGTGFMGAFTTYSTLAVETSLLVRDGSAGVAVAYALATVVPGFVASAAGIWLGGAHRKSGAQAGSRRP